MCACEREEGRAGGREEEEEGVVGEFKKGNCQKVALSNLKWRVCD